MEERRTSNVEQQMMDVSLRPTPFSKRTIGPLGYTVIWFGIAVQITGFATFASMPSYFTIRQLLWVYFIGAILTAIGTIVIQDLGLKHGLPFSISTNATFGYKGSKIITFMRAFPSVIYFAINAFTSAQALNELFKLFFNWDALWVALALIIAAMVCLTLKGLKAIEIFSKIAAPLLLIVGAYIGYCAFDYYGVSLTELLNMGGTGESRSWVYGISVALGLFIMCSLSNNDFTRDCRVKEEHRKSWVKRNAPYNVGAVIGIVPFMVYFSILGNIFVVLSGRTDVVVVMCEVVQHKSIVVAAFVQIFIIAAQLSTNTSADLLPSAYVACSYFKKLKYSWSVIVIAVLAVVVQPWSYYQYLDFVLNLFAIVCTPAIGIIALDYFYFRKRKVDYVALYDSSGKYKYWKGFNPAAVGAFLIGAGLCCIIDINTAAVTSVPVCMLLYYCFGKLQIKKYGEAMDESKNESMTD